MAICADLQDGTLNGTYTQAQWNAFLSDPTVQGYCNVIVPPCAYKGPSGNGGGSTCSSASSAAATKATKASPVPLTPVAVVKGATHTLAPHAPHAPLATTATRGTLPFTGVQLSVVLAFGLALIAAGTALRLTGRRGTVDHR